MVYTITLRLVFFREILITVVYPLHTFDFVVQAAFCNYRINAWCSQVRSCSTLKIMNSKIRHVGQVTLHLAQCDRECTFPECEESCGAASFLLEASTGYCRTFDAVHFSHSRATAGIGISIASPFLTRSPGKRQTDSLKSNSSQRAPQSSILRQQNTSRSFIVSSF